MCQNFEYFTTSEDRYMKPSEILIMSVASIELYMTSQSSALHFLFFVLGFNVNIVEIAFFCLGSYSIFSFISPYLILSASVIQPYLILSAILSNPIFFYLQFHLILSHSIFSFVFLV